MSDMDATLPVGVAYAAALSHNPLSGETAHTSYRSDEGHHDPVRWAKGLVQSCEDDFPGWIWTVVANEIAWTIYTDRRIASILGESDPHPDPTPSNPEGTVR